MAYRWPILAMLVGAALVPCVAGKMPPTAVHIGSRLELLLDDTLIDRMHGLAFKLHAPQPKEVAVHFDKPWEGPVSTYVTVFKDGRKYRMYYRGVPKGEDVTCYAESADGITWQKPALGIHEAMGAKETNIVWRGKGAHTFTPFLDKKPGTPAHERYKALAGTGSGDPLTALASADGIHWKKLREGVLTKGHFDSQNLAFWDTEQKQYACYFRFYDPVTGVRAIARSTSPDFLSWSESRFIDLSKTPAEHLYTNATTPYFRAPHIYLAFPMRFMPTRKVVPEHPLPGISDAVFMSSRDGIRFDRRFMEAFVRPGRDRKNWTERSMMIAWGLLPTAADEISLYWVENYRHPTNSLRRGTLRTDGFVSLNAPYAGGEFVTKPLVFAGKELVLNYATSAAGSIQIEAQDADGRPVPGLRLTDGDPLYGDEITAAVRWKKDGNLGMWAGKPIRLRFVMKDADLYSFQFR